MTYETLIMDYSKAVGKLAMNEIRKSQIELSELDLSSKETMVKVCTSLMQRNDEYKKIHEENIELKSIIEVTEKQISIVRELINKDILKSLEQATRFLETVNG